MSLKSKPLYLPKLIAPDNIKGRFSKWTLQELHTARREWMLAKAKEGYPGQQIAAALGIAQTNVSTKLRDLGYNWSDQKRSIVRKRK